MVRGFTRAGIERLACGAPPRTDLWLAHLAEHSALRIGARPTLYGRTPVTASLLRFLRAAAALGSCGCDVMGEGDYWVAETDISFRARAAAPSQPCILCLRTAGPLILDLRVYIDLAPLADLPL